MKKLIIEITYQDQAGLKKALRKIAEDVFHPGEFRSVRNDYSAIGFLHVDDIDKHKIINGQYCHVIKSKL